MLLIPLKNQAKESRMRNLKISSSTTNAMTENKFSTKLKFNKRKHNCLSDLEASAFKFSKTS